jgi:UDP-N-acetylglucosamine--N-acetylmuramyl-(pentapeptide) pyrophosphoryl-undecaprenol N-acetylglucosamine transferase
VARKKLWRKSPLRPNKFSTLVIAGGGTGGHVLAGISIADAWKAETGSESKVYFIGTRGGMEEKLVPKSGYPLYLLRIGALNQVSLKRKIFTLFQLPLAFVDSLIFFLKTKPDVVIGVGGYSSGPAVLVARLLGIHSAILEQNVVSGLTNRWLSRFVHRIFSAFPLNEKSHLPKEKVEVTGNPVRSKLNPELPIVTQPFTVFIFGGSQGAIGINTLVLDSLDYLKIHQAKIQFIHQTGEKDFDRVNASYEKHGFRARVEKFIYEMGDAYKQSSLVICRAGSSTLAELARVRRPAVLIPYPFASDRHQEKNALQFVQAGACEILLQDKSTGKDIAEMILRFHNDPNRLEKMAKNIAKFDRPDAAKKIVKMLREHHAS